jgi:hypothetical protein
MNDIEYIEALQNLITQRNELRSALAEKEKECKRLREALESIANDVWSPDRNKYRAKQALEGKKK